MGEPAAGSTGKTPEDPGRSELEALARRGVDAAATAGQPARLTIDYPQDGSLFPPEMVPLTFLWHDSDAQADTWLFDIALAGGAKHLRVWVPGNPPEAGPIDPACISETNELYQPTEYQASARSWTPGGEVWAAIRRDSVDSPASVTVFGVSSSEPDHVRSRGTVSLATSRDPVGAPIFYRDVPLAPSLTEKGVIKPLGDEAIGLIGWRLRDVSQPESRLLLTDVPTCTNCHSISDDGKTLGMDLDGPQGDKGAYVLASVASQTRLEQKDVISWNSFPEKAPGQKTIGFLSRVSPDGQYVVTTLNESVYVSNFMDYRFLQVFYPTRGILGYYNRATGEIKRLPGADDPEFVHCDAVWTPDGRQIVFARAVAKAPYPEDGRLAQQPNDPRETQVQYDLMRMPFRDGQGGTSVPIAGASANGMSNTFPKVTPDGKWIVFVQCRNGQLLRPDSKLWIVPLEGGEARLMRCNTRCMNSWHSIAPNGRWMVFSSKANTPYTQMFLTHLDANGNDSPAILLPGSTASNRAVNLPEFVNLPYDSLQRIEVPGLDYYRSAQNGLKLAKAGQLDEALAEFDKAVQLQPDFLPAHVEAAVVLTQKGMLAEAEARLNRAMALNPQHSRAQTSMGIVLGRTGRLDEARARFENALKIDPYYRPAHSNLGRVLLQQGEVAQASEQFRAAVELDETDPQGHFELAQALVRREMLPEAIEQYRKTIELDPQAVEPRLALAKVYAMQSRFRQAVEQLQEATRIDPGNIRPLSDLAWMLAVCPDDSIRNGQAALELAGRACTLTGRKNPTMLHTLSAAYAETGDFGQAIAVATEALKLADPQDTTTVAWIQQSLDRFRAGKPSRRLPGESAE